MKFFLNMTCDHLSGGFHGNAGNDRQAGSKEILGYPFFLPTS